MVKCCRKGIVGEELSERVKVTNVTKVKHFKAISHFYGHCSLLVKSKIVVYVTKVEFIDVLSHFITSSMNKKMADM